MNKETPLVMIACQCTQQPPSSLVFCKRRDSGPLHASNSSFAQYPDILRRLITATVPLSAIYPLPISLPNNHNAQFIHVALFNTSPICSSASNHSSSTLSGRSLHFPTCFWRNSPGILLFLVGIPGILKK
jgi:hypothetical protein